MTETTTPAAGRRRPLLIAAAAAAAALLVGGVALVATGGDDGPPRLDLDAASPTGGSGGGARVAESADLAADDAAGTSMMAWVRYVAADELPDLGGEAPVYRLAADDDDLRTLAQHFGLEGDITVDGPQHTIAEGDASVSRFGASWSYSSGKPYPGSQEGSGDEGVSCDPEGACEEPAPAPEPERPADLPTQAEAEDIVRAVAEAAGLDLTDARVTAYDNVDTWAVNVELALDGTPIPGWGLYGTVMAGGEILDAGGSLGSLEQVGTYPLDTTRVAIDRLNEQSGGGQGSPEPAPTEPAPGPPEPDVMTDPAAQSEPAAGGGTTGSEGTGSATPAESSASEPMPPDAATSSDAGSSGATEPASDDMSTMPVEGDGEPITVTLRTAERSYTMTGNADGTETYLVPVYLLDGEDDRGEQWLDVFAIAVRAELLGG